MFAVSSNQRHRIAADAVVISIGATRTVSNAGTTGPNADALHGASKSVFRPASDVRLDGCTTDINHSTSSSPVFNDCSAASGSTLCDDTLHTSADGDYAGSARHCVFAISRWAAAAF
jgi:hypothetical protein